jgi:nucleotide-binding universal stress UspA family protein
MAAGSGSTQLYKHLLCAVDFSDVSRSALEWALAFAKDTRARVTVLHVLDKTLLSVGNLVAAPGALEEMRRRAEESFAVWKGELDFDEARVTVVDGVPADAILSTAHRSEVDLVVMGTFGLSGIQKFLLGSVTEKVLHRLRVPLLTVSSGVDERGLRVSVRPKTLLMAIDLDEDSPVVIRHGLWLAEHYRAKLIAVHAAPIPAVLVDDRTFQMIPPEALVAIEDSLLSERREKLEGLLPPGGTEVEIVVTMGAPFDVLRAHVRERSADMLILGAGGRGEARRLWLGSTTHKMVRSAACPVLIVR